LDKEAVQGGKGKVKECNDSTCSSSPDPLRVGLLLDGDRSLDLDIVLVLEPEDESESGEDGGFRGRDGGRGRGRRVGGDLGLGELESSLPGVVRDV
jgi:hypothetical protein